MLPTSFPAPGRAGLGLAVAASLALVFPPGAPAESIGINFGAGRSGASLAGGDVAGAVPQSNWNNAAGAGGGPLALADDSGTASGASVTWATDEEWSSGNPTGPDGQLLLGWISENGAPDSSIDIAGIPYAAYDLYVYTHHDRAAEDTVLGEAGGAFAPFTLVETDDDGGGNESLASVTFTRQLTSGAGAGNYAVFTGLSAPTLNLTLGVGSGQRAPVSAVQIVEAVVTPGLPEVATSPATAVTATSATANGDLLDNGDGADSADLTIYWGLSDAGADAGAWGSAAPAGSRTGPGAFGAALSGLSPNTTYFFRAYASNSAGDAWAPASETFTTRAAPPTVANLPASDVFATEATLGGEVTATGGEVPVLTLYYGDEDGGAEPGAWDASIALGAQGGAATATASGLAPGTTYYFRAAATNSGGTAWAPASASFATPTVTLPTVANLPATGVNGTFATLRGEVTDTGGDPPTVAIYYGTADGGSDKLFWNVALGLGPQAGPFSAVAANLEPETTYYFRALAANAAGEAWAGPALSFTTPAFVAPSVVINEIHYDPNDKTSREEFVELHNPSDTAVDLSGYYFSAGIDFSFPAGATLPAGGYVVVAEDPAALAAEHGYAGAFGPFANGTSLRNSGETITLRDPGGNRIDEVDYKLGFPWPTVGDLVGSPLRSPSIELVHPLLDNDLGGSWRASGFPVNSATGGGGPVDFVASGDLWEYEDNDSDLTGTDWNTTVGGGWASGPSQLGYNEDDEATLVGDGDGDYGTTPRAITTYFRRAVTITGLAGFTNMNLGILRDDGAVVYINGVEAFRDNMPGGVIGAETLASGSVGGGNEDQFFDHNVSPALFVEGVNIIAVEIHQSSAGSSDISFDLTLTGEVDAAAADNAPTPGAANRSLANNAPPQLRQVDHTPAGRIPGRDKSVLPGEDVLVTAKATDPDGVGSVLLEYQLVDPGDYIEAEDPRYASGWTSVPMVDDGTGGDAVAADSTYSAVLPGALHTHRRLVRYRIVATDGAGLAIRAPYADDPGRNFAYFVYGGAPAWQAGGQTFDFNQLEPVPVYHLITTRTDHVDSQFIPDSTRGSGYTGSDYLWDGALVYDGVVYDHIKYRARGGVWRYAMGKNMWKFDFHRGRRLQARDDYGRKYSQEWDKLNFSALIQQGNFGQRGEQGLFEGAGFKLHNLAGNPAPNTHFVHFRIIEDASETGPSGSQFDDDFQGLYLAVEQLDGQFLDEHGLPDGNFYKMEGGSGELNNQGPGQPSDKADLNAFFAYKTSAQTQAWWEANLNLPDYYSFRAIATAVHDYDIHAGKNYFFYHRPADPLDPDGDRWQVINWDLDLTWTTTYGGGGTRGPLSDHVLAIPQFALDYRNRTREIMDLLFNTDQAGMVLDEVAQFVHTPGQPSFVDADKAMWDTNPILTSGYVNSSKAGHNRYWQAVAPRSFANMKTHVKNYIDSQRNFMQTSILNADEASVPATPTLSYTGTAGFPVNGLQFTSSSYSSPAGSPFAAMEWRLGEVTPPAMLNKLEPPKYEIEAVWESGELSGFSAVMDYPTTAVRAGSTYRARVRHKDAAGRWGHWSAPVEFVASAPDVTPYIDALRVTEIHYHPTDETPAEQAMGWTARDFEFLEIQNVSAAAVDLTDLRFTKGADFDFPAGSSLGPGAYALIVADTAAFESRYGAGLPVLGEWDPADSLSNGGEDVKLSFGAGIAVVEFTYDDSAPWPTAPDGGGYSLVLDCPEESLPADHGDPLAWRASRLLGGSPGAADSTDFESWAAARGIAADPGSDLDGDGLSALLEFALAADPSSPSPAALPRSGVAEFDFGGGAEGYLTLRYRHPVGAKDLTYLTQASADLLDWDTLDAVWVATEPHGDGTATTTWRAAAPLGQEPRLFLRLRVER